MIYRTLIEVFVGLCLVSVLISNPNQQQPPLSTVYCYLPDYLVKTLIEQLFPHRTETNLPRLPPDQSSIELFMELDDFYLGGRGGEDSLDPELSVVGAMLLGREDLSQDIFGVMQFFILLVGVMVFVFYQFNATPANFNPVATEAVYNSEYAAEYKAIEQELRVNQKFQKGAAFNFTKDIAKPFIKMRVRKYKNELGKANVGERDSQKYFNYMEKYFENVDYRNNNLLEDAIEDMVENLRMDKLTDNTISKYSELTTQYQYMT